MRIITSSAEALKEIEAARAEGRTPDLRRADLRRADLRGLDLRDADLRGVDLRQAKLSNAILFGAKLSNATLSGADLRRVDLYGANLHYADLRDADLRDAYLTGASLSGARGGLLQISDLPSGQLTLAPTCEGWHLGIGCWSGSIGDLGELFTKPDEEWPEARGAERVLRESFLRAALELVKLHVKNHDHLIDTLAELWGQ